MPFKWIAATLAGLTGWGFLYAHLEGLAQALTRQIGIEEGTHLFEALSFFFYDTPKVLMLLCLVIFVMGVIRSYFSPEQTRRFLVGKKEWIGTLAAACLGILTPFCSCSAVPLFIGFVAAGVPLGTTLAFLIASPMVNEIALGLLFGLVGWKIALLYLGFGLFIATLSGMLISKLKLEGWLEEWVKYSRAAEPLNAITKPSMQERLTDGLNEVRQIVGKVWPWIVAGVAAGAFIHGYAPQEFLLSIMGKDAWWSVPASVLVGVPLYANAAGIIPIVEALLEKGASLGTVLAFMMSVTALSVPEAIILRKVMTLRLILLYFGIVACGILGTGYLFNLLLVP
ncbi:MAG: permease [Bdellovibrionales bacterium]